MAVVYIHLKPHNREIFYIGIGNERQRAFRKAKRNEHWHRVFDKYGMIVDIIADGISLESAREMEKFLIASYGVKNLCNQTLGGEGAFGLKHSLESRKKMSDSLKGRITTAETRAKISAKSKGHPNYLKCHSEETKKKLSEMRRGVKRSEYFCQQVKKSKQGYSPSQKARDMSVQKRRDNAKKMIETTTGFVGTAIQMEERFGIPRKSIYDNMKFDKRKPNSPLKDYQFKYITTL
jgi:hypothetical protein